MDKEHQIITHKPAMIKIIRVKTFYIPTHFVKERGYFFFIQPPLKMTKKRTKIYLSTNWVTHIYKYLPSFCAQT